jgi:hypothetical protein
LIRARPQSRLIVVLPRAVRLLPLLVLACQAEPAERTPTSTVAPPPITSPASPPKPVELAELEHPTPHVELEPVVTTAVPVEPEEPAPTLEPPKDELAGELPTGPEPGSPESDAELLALLDDSTLTQDEFAKAFGSGKDPKIDDEGQFSFGAGERSRGRSKIGIGAATLTTGQAKPADLEALAAADLRDLEVCHAMALSKDAEALGRVVLTIELGSQGSVEHVAVESKLGSSLGDCLASVAKTWTVTGAGKATLELPLSLSTQ